MIRNSAKTGSSNHDYPKNVGKFGTSKTNRNGNFLVRLIIRNNFYLCNTLFKHKLEHINTWTSNYTPDNRRNPFRSQIDYIIAPLNFKQINTDSRAYSGLLINADHKLVISNFVLKRP